MLCSTLGLHSSGVAEQDANNAVAESAVNNSLLFLGRTYGHS